VNDLYYIKYNPELMLCDTMDMTAATELAHRRLSDFIWRQSKAYKNNVPLLIHFTKCQADQWPEVLAARSELSDSGASANFATAHRRRSERSLGVGRGGRNRLTASPLGRLHKRLVKEMWRITREEHPEYRRAMIDVLRMMAEAQAPTHKGG